MHLIENYKKKLAKKYTRAYLKAYTLEKQKKFFPRVSKFSAFWVIQSQAEPVSDGLG